MRRAIASALMMTLLLLPGCGEREARAQEGFDSLRAAVTAAGSIRFQAALTADWGDTTAEYTMEVDYDGRQTVQRLHPRQDIRQVITVRPPVAISPATGAKLSPSSHTVATDCSPT